MAELAFEYLTFAFETTRGTAVTPPAYYLPLKGALTPNGAKARPDESRGVLAATTQSKTVQRWADLSGEGGLSSRLALLLAHMCVNGSPSAPSVVTAGQTWLWTFNRGMTSDNLRAITAYFGDPNVQIFQGAYGLLDNWTISADATGTDAVQTSFSGRTRFPSAVSAPTLPSMLTSALMAPADMQLWLDTASAFGTTEITGRFVSCELTIPTGVTYKWLASGPSGTRTYVLTGRQKTSSTLKMVFEFVDTTQYNLFANSSGDTQVRTRVRWNGDVIESTNRHYVQADVLGPFDAFAWGENAGSNRTLEMTITGEYNTSTATDLTMAIQTNIGTL